MNLQLTQKERMLLEDQKHQEGICIKKYQNYAGQAQDPQLKEIFNRLAGQEQQHYNTIDQMLQGQMPNIGQGQQNNSQGQQNNNQGTQQTQNWQQTANSGTMTNAADEMLCSDLLSTEKYVSSTYDIGIFESANHQVREALQHIQQEEHQHGEELFNYMNSHGMYNVK